jgi:hypothetical protein
VIGAVALSALHGSFRGDFAAATHAGWWIVVGCGVAITLLGLLTTGGWARRTAEQTARRLMPSEESPPVPSRSPDPARGVAGPSF